MSEYYVDVMDVMTGEKYPSPIHGLPFDGPYAVSVMIPGERVPRTISVKNAAELEELARKAGFGNKITVNTEK
ncbi:hypothetical protein HY449_04700 [Candidatus Pacearchaeota archaeon]|nr:hypothetical protein [Candidatus Pacearchaeota archaeon]